MAEGLDFEILQQGSAAGRWGRGCGGETEGPPTGNRSPGLGFSVSGFGGAKSGIGFSVSGFGGAKTGFGGGRRRGGGGQGRGAEFGAGRFGEVEGIL